MSQGIKLEGIGTIGSTHGPNPHTLILCFSGQLHGRASDSFWVHTDTIASWNPDKNDSPQVVAIIKRLLGGNYPVRSLRVSRSELTVLGDLNASFGELTKDAVVAVRATGYDVGLSTSVADLLSIRSTQRGGI